MRRRRILSFDAWVCLALAFLVGLGVGKIAEKLAAQHYAQQVEAHKPVDGQIGGKAGADVFRAQNVDDLLSHDTFTVVSPGIQYRNRGAGYYDGKYFQALTLPSGELVAAWINGESVQSMGEDLFSGDNILPLGRVVTEDLTSNQTFLDQIQFSEPLTRTDFYVDMVGDTAVLAEDQAVETPKTLAQVLTVFLLFPVFHIIGSKIGIWRPYFVLRKKDPADEMEGGM